MLRKVMFVTVVVAALLPMAVSAEVVFIPQAHNGVRDWFTVTDVTNWIAETHNVMPVTCIEVKPGIFETCTVDQAQPLTLVWDDVAGKVVAHD